MGQQVSVTKLKEQIEAAKRSLAEMSPVITAATLYFSLLPCRPQILLVWLVGSEMMRQTSTKIAANDDMATR